MTTGNSGQGTLLAVDLGIRTGLAFFGSDGRLRWYGSRNFGRRSRLRDAIPGILNECPCLSRLVLEGGGDLAEIWIREADRRRVTVMTLYAEEWREGLLLPRDRRSGADAKRNALAAARVIIEWSGAKRPTSLRHDAAEAVLAGFWGAMEAGMIDVPPEGLFSNH